MNNNEYLNIGNRIEISTLGLTGQIVLPIINTLVENEIMWVICKHREALPTTKVLV